jgi:predicted transposase YbfD/YdcC
VPAQSATPSPAPETGQTTAEAGAASGLAVALNVQECADLRNCLAGLPEPRKPRGLLYPVAALVAVMAAALLGGADSAAAIYRWAAYAPEEVLLALGCRRNRRTGKARRPSLKTLRRLLPRLDAEALDAALARWTCAQVAAGRGPDRPHLCLDGKQLRGSRGADGKPTHLFAALLHEEGVVVAQTGVDSKTNETKRFAPLLDALDIAGAVVTADALHTVRAHARYLHRRGAFYVFTVKENTPALFEKINAVDWEKIPVGWVEEDKAHGREERRVIKTAPAPAGLGFPHAKQVMLIERYVTDTKTGKKTAVAVLAVTNLPPEKAGPADLARHIRRHWGIENRLHWVRDSATFREDNHKLAEGNAPHVMASLRNLAVNALRLSGFTSIAAGREWARSDYRNPLSLLGLTM